MRRGKEQQEYEELQVERLYHTIVAPPPKVFVLTCPVHFGYAHARDPYTNQEYHALTVRAYRMLTDRVCQETGKSLGDFMQMEFVDAWEVTIVLHPNFYPMDLSGDGRYPDPSEIVFFPELRLKP